MKKLKLSIVILQVDVSSAVAYVMSVREDQELNHVKVCTLLFLSMSWWQLDRKLDKSLILEPYREVDLIKSTCGKPT